MAHPVVQLVFFLALGLCVIHFARSTYSRPDLTRQRWFQQLPDRAWSLALLRGIAVVWIFGGFILISQGVTAFPFMSGYRGAKLFIVVTAVAVAATALVVSTTPRRRLKVH